MLALDAIVDEVVLVELSKTASNGFVDTLAAAAEEAILLECGCFKFNLPCPCPDEEEDDAGGGKGGAVLTATHLGDESHRKSHVDSMDAIFENFFIHFHLCVLRVKRCRVRGR